MVDHFDKEKGLLNVFSFVSAVSPCLHVWTVLKCTDAATAASPGSVPHAGH